MAASSSRSSTVATKRVRWGQGVAASMDAMSGSTRWGRASTGTTMSTGARAAFTMVGPPGSGGAVAEDGERAPLGLVVLALEVGGGVRHRVADAHDDAERHHVLLGEVVEDLA